MKTPWLIAHRGAPKIAPENTLGSFEAALQFRIQAIELDVHLTKDNQLVVHHDEKLGRIVKGHGELLNLTLSQLRELEVKGKPGEKIPTLEEALNLCRGRCHLIVEAKVYPDRAEALAKVLAKTLVDHAKPQDATVISFCHPAIENFHRFAPGYSCGPSLDKPGSWSLSFKPNVVVLNHKILNEESCAVFLKEGIAIWTYTVNAKKEWERLAKLGVDGVITDRPDLFSSQKTPTDFP